VRILLDTHVWLWFVVAPERIGPTSRALLEDRDHQLLLSAASSWEMAIKYRLGKLPLPSPPEEFIPPRLARDEITPLPVDHAHALRVATLPLHYRDPFDRLLVAQAQLEDLVIFTADEAITQYDVQYRLVTRS